MTGPLTVVVDDLTAAEVQALVLEHLAGMHEHSPPDSVHALGLQALRAPDVTVWTAWDGAPGTPGRLAGCGALRELDPVHGEVKSMRTASAYLRRGVAAALLERILETARERGYRRVSLETGHGPAFDAAHALYARHGFVPCGPFGDYTDDAFSRYLTWTPPHVAGDRT